MGVAAGSHVGAYEVVAPLGAGGMGEVYRARDARLGREVALKVLPAAVAADADRLRRFEQEARADGRDLRRLIDDPARDRATRFIHDERRIVLFSNRGGPWEV